MAFLFVPRFKHIVLPTGCIHCHEPKPRLDALTGPTTNEGYDDQVHQAH